MKQNTIVALCVLLLVAVGVAVVGTQAIAGQEPTPEREHDDEVPSNVTISTSPAIQTSTTQTNTYTVVATDPGAVNISQLESFGEVSTHSGRLLEVHLSPNATQDVAALPWVEEVRLAAAPVPTQTNSGENASSLGVAQLHEAGVTGEGARVGVIDAGFDTGAPGVGSNTVDTRQFTTPSGSDHGTAVAQIVTQTAPNASLYLATARTPPDLAAALEYFSDNDVDVVVMAIGFPTLNDDGQHVLAEPIAQARADGALVVASAGNQRQSHWEGRFLDTNGNDFHEFSGAVGERQCIPSCTRLAQPGRLVAVLDWEREGDGSEYRIGLYDPSTNEVFAGSVPRYETRDDKRQYLQTQVTERPVDLVLWNTAGPANDDLEIHLYNRRMADPVGRSSISPPSDAPAALSVAAYARSQGQTASYSSLGPTDDGRTQPSITGYTDIAVERYDGPFGGTSAAAPYVAGVAALIEGATSADQSPAMLTRRLQANSTDINTPGTDNVSGAGLLNASATVTISQNSSTGRNSTTAVYELNSTPAAYDGDDDGQISISELAVAGQAYVRGELTIAELATVGRAYINSTG